MQPKLRNKKCIGKCKIFEKFNTRIDRFGYKTSINKARIIDIRRTEGIAKKPITKLVQD
jgi:hypothetical protein